MVYSTDTFSITHCRGVSCKKIHNRASRASYTSGISGVVCLSTLTDTQR